MQRAESATAHDNLLKVLRHARDRRSKGVFAGSQERRGKRNLHPRNPARGRGWGRSDVTYTEFRNAHASLNFIDLPEFERAVTAINPNVRWADYADFSRNPASWLARQADDIAEAVWALVQKKEPSR
jgi:hypothetical protein